MKVHQTIYLYKYLNISSIFQRKRGSAQEDTSKKIKQNRNETFKENNHTIIKLKTGKLMKRKLSTDKIDNGQQIWLNNEE